MCGVATHPPLQLVCGFCSQIRVVDRAASARDAVADLAAWQCLVALVDSDSYALDAHLSILSDAMRACIVRFEICTSADVCKALMTVLERVGDATSTAAVIEPVLNACWHQLETAHGSFCAFEAAVAIVAAVAKQKSYRMLLVANADAMLIALEAAIAALPLHTRPFATRRVFGILASAAVSPPLPLSYTIESAVCDGAGDGDINATTSLATAVYFQAAGALVAQCPGNLAFVRRQSRAVAAAIGCLVSHRVYAAPVRASAARLLRALDHPIASAVVAELAQRLMVVAATSSGALALGTIK